MLARASQMPERSLVKLRPVAAAAVALAVVFGAAGCNMFSPQATGIHYDPSDGISGETGLVLIRNAVIVKDATADDERGSLAVTLVNQGDAVAVDVQIGSETQRLTIEPGTTTFGFEESQVVFDSVSEPFGAHQNVSFSADGAQAVSLPVQVLSTESAGYEELGPTAAPVAAEPAATDAAGEPAETPAPTETAAP